MVQDYHLMKNNNENIKQYLNKPNFDTTEELDFPDPIKEMLEDFYFK